MAQDLNGPAPVSRSASFRPLSRRDILPGMSTRPRSQPGPPMTLGNMGANGVRSLDVCCWLCHHRAILSADPWSDDIPVPSFGPRMVCTIRADARPNWPEQSPRERV
jgi:hypothetical protein